MAAERRAAWTVLSGGAAGRLLASDCPPGPLVSLIGQRAWPYLFFDSLPPAIIGCASKALDLLMGSTAIGQPMAAETQPCSPSRVGKDGVGEPPCAYPALLPILSSSAFSFHFLVHFSVSDPGSPHLVQSSFHLPFWSACSSAWLPI